MSYGLMCLTCRLYINPADKQWACKCERPVPSEDGKTPVNETVMQRSTDRTGSQE